MAVLVRLFSGAGRDGDAFSIYLDSAGLGTIGGLETTSRSGCVTRTGGAGVCCAVFISLGGALVTGSTFGGLVTGAGTGFGSGLDWCCGGGVVLAVGGWTGDSHPARWVRKLLTSFDLTASCCRSVVVILSNLTGVDCDAA